MSGRHLAGTVGLVLLLGVQATTAYIFGAERVQGNVAVLTLAWSLWFVWIYSRDPWWKTWFGRSLMLLAVGLTLNEISVVLFRNLGDYPGRAFLIVVAQDVILAAMVIRTLVLRDAQRRDDRKHLPRS
jgi:hypothetical protein